MIDQMEQRKKIFASVFAILFLTGTAVALNSFSLTNQITEQDRFTASDVAQGGDEYAVGKDTNVLIYESGTQVANFSSPSHRIEGIEYSPDGQDLAFATSQDLHIVDRGNNSIYQTYNFDADGIDTNSVSDIAWSKKEGKGVWVVRDDANFDRLVEISVPNNNTVTNHTVGDGGRDFRAVDAEATPQGLPEPITKTDHYFPLDEGQGDIAGSGSINTDFSSSTSGYIEEGRVDTNGVDYTNFNVQNQTLRTDGENATFSFWWDNPNSQTGGNIATWGSNLTIAPSNGGLQVQGDTCTASVGVGYLDTGYMTVVIEDTGTGNETVKLYRNGGLQGSTSSCDIGKIEGRPELGDSDGTIFGAKWDEFSVDYDEAYNQSQHQELYNVQRNDPDVEHIAIGGDDVENTGIPIYDASGSLVGNITTSDYTNWNAEAVSYSPSGDRMAFTGWGSTYIVDSSNYSNSVGSTESFGQTYSADWNGNHLAIGHENGYALVDGATYSTAKSFSSNQLIETISFYDDQDDTTFSSTLVAGESSGTSESTFYVQQEQDDPFAGGDGTSSNPYQINTCSQLEDAGNYLESHFELTSDVDCSSYGNFEPIGGAGDGDTFNQTFNGNGYAVKNVQIEKSTSDVGLFGRTGELESVVIENLVVRNISVNYTGSGGSYFGGVVGYMEDGTTVRDVTVTGEVRASDANGFVGGLAGTSYATVRRGLAQVDVYGDSNTAGMVGSNEGDIYNSVSVTDTVNAPDYGSVGGFVGGQVAGTTTDSYWDNETLQSQTDGGSDSGLVAVNNTSNMLGDSANSTLSNLDFTNNWKEVTATESDTGQDEYPILRANNDTEQIQALTVSIPEVNVDIQNEDRADIPNNENFYLDTSGGANYGFTIGTSLGVVDEANFTAEYDNGTVMDKVEKTNYDTDGIDYINIAFDESVSTANLTASIKDEDGVGSEEITVNTYFPSFTSTLNSPDIQNGNVTVVEGEGIDGNASVDMSNFGTGTFNAKWGAEDYSLAFSQTIDGGQYSTSSFTTNATDLIPSSEITDGEQFRIDVIGDFSSAESDTFTLLDRDFTAEVQTVEEEVIIERAGGGDFNNNTVLYDESSPFEFVWVNVDNKTGNTYDVTLQVQNETGETIYQDTIQNYTYGAGGDRFAPDFPEDGSYEVSANVSGDIQGSTTNNITYDRYAINREFVEPDVSNTVYLNSGESLNFTVNVSAPELSGKPVYGGVYWFASSSTNDVGSTGFNLDNTGDGSYSLSLSSSEVSTPDSGSLHAGRFRVDEADAFTDDDSYSAGTLSVESNSAPSITDQYFTWDFLGEHRAVLEINDNGENDIDSFQPYLTPDVFSNSTLQYAVGQDSSFEWTGVTVEDFGGLQTNGNDFNFTKSISSPYQNESFTSNSSAQFVSMRENFTNVNGDTLGVFGDKPSNNIYNIDMPANIISNIYADESRKTASSGETVTHEFTWKVDSINVYAGDQASDFGQGAFFNHDLVEQKIFRKDQVENTGGTTFENTEVYHPVFQGDHNIVFDTSTMTVNPGNQTRKTIARGDYLNESFSNYTEQDTGLVSTLQTQYVDDFTNMSIENERQNVNFTGINVTSVCQNQDTVNVSAGATENKSCKTGDRSIDQIQVTGESVADIREAVNKEHTANEQFVNTFKDAELQNNAGIAFDNVNVTESCKVRRVSQMSDTVTVPQGASTIPYCNVTTSGQDYISESYGNFEPQTDQPLVIERNYTGVQPATLTNNNDTVNFTDVDYTDSIATPYQQCSPEKAKVNLTAGESVTENTTLDCEVGELSPFQKSEENQTVNGNNVKEIGYSTDITVYSNETKNNALTYTISKLMLDNYTDRISGSVEVEVDNKTSDITTTEDNTTVYVTVQDDFGNSSLEQGTHNAEFTYHVERPEEDDGTSPGSGTESDSTDEEESVSFSQTSFTVNPGEVEDRSFRVTWRGAGSNNVNIRVPTESEDEGCSAFEIQDSDGDYGRLASYTIESEQTQEVPVRIELDENATSAVSCRLDIGVNRGELGNEPTVTANPQATGGVLTGNFFSGTTSLPSLSSLGDIDVAEDSGSTAFIVFTAVVLGLGAIMWVRFSGGVREAIPFVGG